MACFSPAALPMWSLTATPALPGSGMLLDPQRDATHSAADPAAVRAGVPVMASVAVSRK